MDFNDKISQLAKRIDNGTANLQDYYSYESLLLESGLSKEYIYSYLNEAGLKSWEELLRVRKIKEKQRDIKYAILIGGLVGISTGILLAQVFNNKS